MLLKQSYSLRSDADRAPQLKASVGWLFMATPEMTLERYYLIVSDLRLAHRFADYILTNRLHDKKSDRTQLVHRAFNLSMIVSYCRPFTRNVERGEIEPADSPIYRSARRVLGNEQFALHREIIRQRNSVYAHSPAGKRFPLRPTKGKVAVHLDLFEPLKIANTRKLRSIIKSWLEYLEPRKSEFS